MPLFVHTSNRLESLAEGLANLLRDSLLDPFTAETVVVQNLGMRRWLSFVLAQQLGVTMQIRFPFPEAIVRELLASDPAPDAALTRDALPWRVHAVLPSLLKEPALTPLRDYLAAEPVALKEWQLSTQIAAVFDRYTIGRPEMLADWQQGRVQQGAEWQAMLWEAVTEKGQRKHDAAVFPNFAENLPTRIILFGISSLPPFYLKVLETVSKRTAVHVFFLSPTWHYWGDVLPEKTLARLRRKTGALEHAESGHPLLASLGRIGRDFHDALTGLTPDDVPDAFMEPQGDYLLAQLQRSIFHLGQEEIKYPLRIAEADSSIECHDCHSPLRELEVLHDRLLARFQDDGTLTPRDVLVSVPDIAAYAPLIDAVFGSAEKDSMRFPYTIADRSMRSVNPVADAFLRVLELPKQRCTASEILSLLECPAIQRRFGLCASDLEQCRRWIGEAAIRWGLDAAHRTRLGLPGTDAQTWRQGIDRLLLGALFPAGEERLFAGLLPAGDTEGSATQTLASFVAACDAVFSALESLSTPRSLAEWGRDLVASLAALCSDEDVFADDWQATAQDISRLSSLATDCDHKRIVDESVIRAYLASAFGSTDRGGTFLGGGITFCALKPMRAIPFRVIALLGMDDGKFPRTEHPPSFDLTTRSRKRGDRSLREDDRYVFLEAILSARDALHISWCGQSLRDNSPFPPSVLITELLDHLEKHHIAHDGRNARSRLVFKHRLQAFSPAYFDGTLPRSFSIQNAAAALAAQERTSPHVFASNIQPVSLPREVALERLESCLLSPARFFAREILGICLPQEDKSIEETEPFETDALSGYHLRSTLLRTSSNDATYRWARAAGILPVGHAGDVDWRLAESEAAKLARAIHAVGVGPPLPPLRFALNIGKLTLHGTLSPMHQHGLLLIRPGKLRAKDKLVAWLRHLCQTEQKITHLVALDQVVRFEPCRKPAALLAEIIALFERCHTEPQPFFPLSAEEFESKLAEGKKDPHRAALSKWECSDERYGASESQDPWNRLLWRGHSAPLGEAFQHWALSIFGPLRAHLTYVEASP